MYRVTCKYQKYTVADLKVTLRKCKLQCIQIASIFASKPELFLEKAVRYELYFPAIIQTSKLLCKQISIKNVKCKLFEWIFQFKAYRYKIEAFSWLLGTLSYVVTFD